MKDRFHAALNIMGLAVSLAAALLIALYVQHELSYDDFFTDPGRVYRIEASYHPPGQPPVVTTLSPYQIADALNADYPGQLTATQFFWTSGNVIEADGHYSGEASLILAASNLFDVLDFPVARGDVAAALRQPNTIILTRSMAEKLFGPRDAIGKSLRVNGRFDFTVGAILKDLPDTTHFSHAQFEFGLIASYNSSFFRAISINTDSWSSANFSTFVRLGKTLTEKQFVGALPAFASRHISADDPRIGNMTFRARPLTDIHLKAGDNATPSNQNYVIMAALAATGLLLVFIACFNYVNLALARALLRVPEIGLRKVLGGTTRQLALQFMGEAVLTTVPAFAFAIGIAVLFLPIFSNAVGQSLNPEVLLSSRFILFMAGLLVFTTVTAGAYPAFFLATSRPMAAIQKMKSGMAGPSALRATMISAQFGVTVGLIFTTMVVFSQVHYLQNLELGFNKQGLLWIRPSATAPHGAQAFREALAQSPYFSGVTQSNDAPEAAYRYTTTLSRAGDARHQDRTVLTVYTEANFLDVYGIRLLAGRDFSPDRGVDMLRPRTAKQSVRRASIILSQSAVSYFGFASAREAIGQDLQSSDHQYSYTIIGIVPDVQFRLGRKPMMPTAYLFAPSQVFDISARIKGNDIPEAIAAARKIWSEIFPADLFDYQFIQDRISAANADEARQSRLFAFFTGLAIFVACLGLFGLASFVAARRTREIAIRKVLGASTAEITRLLLWDFAKPVLLANLVAWPIVWLLMRRWLDGFPYRIALSPAFFLGASALALGVALLTVFTRTWRAARIRPATALKYE
jgi:putative ABC transport system permease protein